MLRMLKKPLVTGRQLPDVAVVFVPAGHAMARGSLASGAVPGL